MKKLVARVSVVLFIFVFFVVLPTSAAEKTYSFKLFDPMTVPQPEVVGGGRVAWWTQFPFHIGIVNRGGKMVISKNPDGTGNARVGDTLQIWTNNPAYGTYRYTYNAYRPNCFFEDPPAMPPQDITSYFPLLHDPYDVTVRILDWCGKEKQTDTLYLVNITNEPEPTHPAATPTPAPSATPTPTPTPVKPFLDLPWDYRSKGLSFTDAALKIEAFFDHKYPLLSSSLKEPVESSNSIVKFDGTKSSDAYSSHDGYDYARRAGAIIGERVLAAASGKASYIGDCPACGHMIVVDHENGFQTRYMHLMKDGLVVAESNKQVHVAAGQQIGKIGFTGNVLPPGDLGAHIHFMVVEDKNRDGRFEDNIPDGATDPFGWSGVASDPWSNYQFVYNGASRQGNKSTYLWTQALDSKTASVNPEKETTVIIPHMTVLFPAGTMDQTYFVQANPAAYSNTNKSLVSIGNAFLLSAYNETNGAITSFKKAFTIRIGFKKSETAAVKPGTLAIYSSPDGQTWRKESTAVDSKKGEATASVDHMTYFALLGERNDSMAPVSTVTLNGKKGQPDWYRSDVKLSLLAKDNKGGSGVEYIAYSIDGGELSLYAEPVTVTTEGEHTVTYFAADKDGNLEDSRSVVFRVDKQAPEAKVQFNTVSGELAAVPMDGNEQVLITHVEKTGQNRAVKLTDPAGNSLMLTIKWNYTPAKKR